MTELNTTNISNKYSNLIDTLLLELGKREDLKGVIKQVKEGGEEYGYYMNKDIYSLLELLRVLNFHSFADLGSGIGLLIAQLQIWFPDKQFWGFEKEENLFKLSSWFQFHGRQIDLMELTKPDIQHIDVLYTYEPFHNQQKQDQYLKLLYSIMDKDQTLLYRTIHYRNNRDRFEDFSFCQQTPDKNLFALQK